MNQTYPEAPAESASPRPERSRRLWIVIAVLAALALALLIWGLLKGGGSGNSARIVTPTELGSLASPAKPIYWAGKVSGTRLEYSKTAGRAYVRYLTGAAKAGDPRPAFLSIGTYPLHDPVAALGANARRTHVKLQIAKKGAARAWVDPARPTSVYLAWPGSRYQVEVYDPSPSIARLLALSGKIRPR